LQFGVFNAKLKTQITDPVFVAFRIVSVVNALWARKIYHPTPRMNPENVVFVALKHVLLLYITSNLSHILKHGEPLGHSSSPSMKGTQ
jgi:hypothetical protein